MASYPEGLTRLADFVSTKIQASDTRPYRRRSGFTVPEVEFTEPGSQWTLFREKDSDNTHLKLPSRGLDSWTSLKAARQNRILQTGIKNDSGGRIGTGRVISSTTTSRWSSTTWERPTPTGTRWFSFGVSDVVSAGDIFTTTRITIAEIDAHLNGEGEGIRRIFALANQAAYSGQQLSTGDFQQWQKTVRSQLKDGEEL